MTARRHSPILLSLAALLLLARGCAGSSEVSPPDACQGGSCPSAAGSAGGPGGCPDFDCSGAAGDPLGASGAASHSPAQGGHKGGGAGKAGAPAGGKGGAAGGATDANGCPIVPVPGDLPADWTQYTGISCDCPLFVPGTSKTMPPPLSWAPCPGALEGKFGCRVLEHPWNPLGLYPVSTVLIHDEVTNRYLLSFAKNGPQAPFTRINVVADIDGDVRFAIGARFEGNDAKCVLAENPANSTSFAYSFLREDGDKKYEGIVSGDYAAGVPQHVTQHEQDPSLGSSWDFTSSLLLQRLGWVRAWSWDLASTTSVYSPDKDAPYLGKNDVVGYKDTVILGVGNGTTLALVSWTKEKGAQTLVYWPSEDKGAFNPGTDGKDLVWTYGEGIPPGTPELSFASYSVMTAPFTSDPATLQKTMRRVRSDFMGPQPWGWQVGCGYAVRKIWRPDTHDALLVVRLADNMSWVLGSEASLNFSWSLVLGVTCEEIVTIAYLKKVGEIVRIRLDALGPGSPPD